jgi:hypothetical protein
MEAEAQQQAGSGSGSGSSSDSSSGSGSSSGSSFFRTRALSCGVLAANIQAQAMKKPLPVQHGVV